MSKKTKKVLLDPFVPSFYHVFLSKEYFTLGSSAVKMLNSLYMQFTGKNNGDLSAAPEILFKRGWKSRVTIAKSLKELIKKGFIQKTRHPTKEQCALYAVTWLKIDDCRMAGTGLSKLDVTPTYQPLKPYEKWEYKK